ncbi:putative C6 finger domain protein [Xylariaceae sp. FL0662B]|nr:putative C6 finger domain protein [Xylariaceae sp. FL0662B]
MEGSRKRHCWECLRRCLVCDSTHPVCKRCSASGIVCPGYKDEKPLRLRWLAPGRTISQNRKPKGTPSDKIANDLNEITTRTTAELSRRPMDMVIPSVPRSVMRTEACDSVQAAEYFNTCIHQDMIPIHELGQNPSVHPISPTHLRAATTVPRHLRLGILCMTLSHRMNRTRDDSHCNSLAEAFYRYRGIAIRSLNEDINVEDKRTGDIVITGVITLLLVDVQQGDSPNWRWHLEGIQKLITLRGGLRALAGPKALLPLLLNFVFLAVIGNTTSPASDLFMTGSHLDELDFILEQSGGERFPFQLCPPLLFAQIIRINHLRMRATKREHARAKELPQEAYEILSRIRGFSPEQWAESKPSAKEDWVLLGRIYQAAVALYCISSLQSLSVLPVASSLRTNCATHGERLQVLLNDALSSPRIKRFMIWPVVILGMEAVNGDAAMRAFVEKQLPEDEPPHWHIRATSSEACS